MPPHGDALTHQAGGSTTVPPLLLTVNEIPITVDNLAIIAYCTRFSIVEFYLIVLIQNLPLLFHNDLSRKNSQIYL